MAVPAGIVTENAAVKSDTAAPWLSFLETGVYQSKPCAGYRIDLYAAGAIDAVVSERLLTRSIYAYL